MAVRNARRTQVFYWKPPNTTPAYKITIERSDGTVDDVTNIISYAEFEDSITESVGRFEISIWNPNEDYTNAWNGNEIVRYYKDYAATATTLRFRGRVEKPSKRYNKVNIKGRSEGKRLFGVTVTKSYSNTETGAILSDLISTYLPTFTTNNVGTSTKSLTVNWFQKPLFSCIKELCSAAGFECYVDKDLDVNYFATGSRKNNTEAIVHGMNMLEIDDFTPDLTLIRNRVIVYGAVIDGIQVIATAEQKTGTYGTNNTSFGVYEEIINDENITDETTAQEVADFELTRLKTPPEVGKVKGWQLATIQPGESIRISSPTDGLIPGTYYNTTGYVDKLDVIETGILSTTVFVNKEPRMLSHILKDRVEQENKKKSTTLNPEGMRYSRNFLFETDTGTHSSTEITKGVLKPTAGTGTWISPSRSLSSNITEAYLLMNGETLTGATVSVSGNNGVNYQAFTANKTKITLSSAIGTNQIVKVEFSNADTQINSLSIQYKLA